MLTWIQEYKEYNTSWYNTNKKFSEVDYLASAKTVALCTTFKQTRDRQDIQDLLVCMSYYTFIT